MQKKTLTYPIVLLPILVALFVWLSPLAFVPVPWPDDSAFYFVAKELFRWPPRWVMLPQAPFEPTYRIFNFNTMPLYPFLIGLGRWIGIDGSFLLKLWPLLAWALSGSALIYSLLKRNLSWLPCLILALAFSLDPTLRWASVLIRPESLIGLFGMLLILRLDSPVAHKLWDPRAALLALAAYSHFNAIHLVLPTLLFILLDSRRPFIEQLKDLIQLGLKTALYLLPWGMVVLLHFKLFIYQMEVQWRRLAVGNSWLNTPRSAVEGLFQQMGSPMNVDTVVHFTGLLFWLLIFASVLILLWQTLSKFARSRLKPLPSTLIAPAAWVLSACWLWEKKPEVWFVYYIHLSLWVLVGFLFLEIQKVSWKGWSRGLKPALLILVISCVGIFGYADFKQFKDLSRSNSWNWQTYGAFIDCIHDRLKQLESDLGHPKPFRVWDPTFPDITVELSRREPEWELTRTNDFWDRRGLAIQHGEDVEAVVVPETIREEEFQYSGPVVGGPSVDSVWMTWKDYFLYDLWKQPGWKPDRYLCFRGRWQAFLYMKASAEKSAQPVMPSKSTPATR